MSRALSVQTYSGSAAINTSFSFADTGVVDYILLKTSAALTTSENLTITQNCNAGSSYDTLIYSRDLSGDNPATSWKIDNTNRARCVTGDAWDIAFANSDGVDWYMSVYYDPNPDL